jgi:hypothetical protein
MTGAEVAKHRALAGRKSVGPRSKKAASSDSSADTAPPDHPARSDRIAALAADLGELAGDGLFAEDDSDINLPTVWGNPPSRAARELAETENLRKAFLTRQSVLAGSISRAQAASLLGLSEQAVTKHLDQGRIIGIKDKGRWAIPSWQLEADTRDGYLNGIEQLARAFPGGPVALTRWVTKPAADFGGNTPRDMLAGNHVDEVVRAAQALTSKGW